MNTSAVTDIPKLLTYADISTALINAVQARLTHRLQAHKGIPADCLPNFMKTNSGSPEGVAKACFSFPHEALTWDADTFGARICMPAAEQLVLSVITPVMTYLVAGDALELRFSYPACAEGNTISADFNSPIDTVSILNNLLVLQTTSYYDDQINERCFLAEIGFQWTGENGSSLA